MCNELHFPAGYAPLTAEEITYTEGGALGLGSVLVGISSAVGSVVLASSYIWGIGQSRAWLKEKDNTEGNIFTILGRAVDDLSADMKQSASNFVRDGVSAAMVTALAPLSAALLFLRR